MRVFENLIKRFQLLNRIKWSNAVLEVFNNKRNPRNAINFLKHLLKQGFIVHMNRLKVQKTVLLSVYAIMDNLFVVGDLKII